MRKPWKWGFGLAVSVAALISALRGINLPQLATTLAQGHYLYLIPAGVGMLLYLIARSVRWRLLLEGRVSLARCFWITNIGYLVSNILPFRLGDPARAVIVGRDGTVATTVALSTVVVERVVDMLMVVLLLAGVLPFLADVGDTPIVGLVAGLTASLSLGALVLLAFHPDRGRALIRWTLAHLPRLNREHWVRSLDGLLEGLAPLRSGRLALQLFLWSLVAWGAAVGFYWALVRLFWASAPVTAAAFLVCVVGLGMAVPSSPGAVGVFHAIARYGLTIPFGVPTDRAVTIAFAMHGFQYALGCLLGLIGLGMESLSLSWVRAEISD